MLNPTLLCLEGLFPGGHALTSAVLCRREKREAGAEHGLQEVEEEGASAEQMPGGGRWCRSQPERCPPPSGAVEATAGALDPEHEDDDVAQEAADHGGSVTSL